MAITCERLPQERLEGLAWLIDAEYKEMPGLRLTFAQARRLWNLSTEECAIVLDYLVDTGRLARQGDYFCRTGAR
jgi:hypothetical protein